MLNTIPIVSVEFSSEINLEPIPEMGAYNVSDVLRGINSIYPQWKKDLLKHHDNYLLKMSINGEYICKDMDDLRVLIPYAENKIYLELVPIMAGDDFLNIGLGIGLVVAGLTGVGLLGISATTLGLAGVGLVFSTLFKHPKQDSSTTENNTKRSINFSGVINTAGGGQVLPIACGKNIAIGSIVASAQVVPYDAAVN